jgi:hypothetical protein
MDKIKKQSKITRKKWEMLMLIFLATKNKN